MKVNEQNENVSLVFTSAKGTKIFAFKDPLSSISALRGVAAEEAKRFASMNITKQELKMLFNKCKTAVNIKKDFTEVMAIIYDIDYRLDMICEEKSLLELAYIFFMLEGEDDEKPSLDFNLKKQKIVGEQTDLKGFFLRTALKLAETFSEKQEDNLLTYLQETKAMSERINRYFSPM